jgi:hypothetical protein
MASKDRSMSLCRVKVDHARPFTACRQRLVVMILIPKVYVTSLIRISIFYR